MPIGVTPRDDELALIESLARKEGKLQQKVSKQYNRDIAQFGGDGGR